MPPTVYLVRHGQSEWNLLRRTQGQTPHPRLTALGRSQAASAAQLIAADLAPRGGRVSRIVSSDLVRATETAGILAASLGAGVTHDIRLREQALGRLEGRSYDETWSAAAEFDWSDPAQPIAGGESLYDVHDRMAAVLDEVWSTEGPIVLVSHGDAIRVAISHLHGVNPHETEWVEVANGAVGRIDAGITWLGQ